MNSVLFSGRKPDREGDIQYCHCTYKYSYRLRGSSVAPDLT